MYNKQRLVHVSQYKIGWSDLDMNGHTSHIVYLSCAANSRVELFVKIGYTLEYMKKKQILPVLLKEYVQYKKETFIHDVLLIETEVIGSSREGNFYIIEHKIKKNNKVCAQLYVEATLIDGKTRTMAKVPDFMKERIRLAIENNPDYKILNPRRPSLRCIIKPFQE